MKAFLGPGLFLLTLALILWGIGRMDKKRPMSERYATIETEESKLLVPLLAVLGLIGTGIGLWAYFYG
jgi:hypothetical protein